MDKDAALTFDQLERALVGSRGVRGREIDRPAVRPRPFDLERACALPHLDAAVDPSLPRGPRDRLRVVSCRPRHNAMPFLLLTHSEDPVDRATGLERARLLEELGLQPDAA